MERSLRAVTRALVRAAFPVGCAACAAMLDDEAALPLCNACDGSLVDVGEPFCLDCARAGGEPRRCARATHLRLAAAFAFDEAVRTLVHAFKFGDAPELAEPLVARAWEGPAFGSERPDRIVPVPLHPVRRRERGYDQAALLARAFAAHAAAPSVAALVRLRATRQQARLGARERAANVAGAFALAQPELVRGKSIALVDDVATTGATLGAAARALREGGAGRVTAWTIAFEPLE
jgi:ComF family protein